MDSFMNGTSLAYASYKPLSQEETKKALTPPLNGGLYTGEPFQKQAGWANVPIVPTVENLVYNNLRSADPPPYGITEYPHYTRPGNNSQNTPGRKVLNPSHNFTCIIDKKA